LVLGKESLSYKVSNKASKQLTGMQMKAAYLEDIEMHVRPRYLNTQSDVFAVHQKEVCFDHNNMIQLSTSSDLVWLEPRLHWSP
jgi:hypothetical protein